MSTMEELHNRHKGRRCFIVGTGPSLLKQTAILPRLNGEITFTVSRVYLWKGLPFRPTYHVITEWTHIHSPLMQQAPWPECDEKFAITPVMRQHNGWTWILKGDSGRYLIHEGTKGLGDTWEPPTNGRSVVLTAAQLALWMGCDPIYLLGCDVTTRGHVWDVNDNRNESNTDERLWKPFGRAALDMAAHGRSLYDCSPGGMLNLHGYLEYRELAEVLVEREGA